MTTTPTALPAVVRASAPTVSAITLPARITAANESSRELAGLILRYGDTAQTSMGGTRFKAGALSSDADLSGVKLLIEHDTERVIGYAKSVTTDGNDVRATFYVAPGPVGDEVLASAAGKLRDGLSVGVQIVEASYTDDGVLEVTAGALRETSVVAVPAFAAARVSSVAAHQPSPQPPQPWQAQQWQAAAPAQAAAVTSWAPSGPAHIGATGGAQTGQTADQAIGRLAAAFRSGVDQATVQAALADVLLPTNAGQRDALFRPQWLGEVWRASKTERPFIDAFGAKSLTSYKVQGFRRPPSTFSVDDYEGNKTEIPSSGDYTIEPIENTAKRLAGGHDFDRAIVDFGNESFIRAYIERMTESYRERTEAKFAADVLAAATARPAASTTVGAIAAAAAYFAGIGARANVVALSPDLWAGLLGLTQLDAPWLFGGNAQIDGQGGTIGGVKLATISSLPAGTLLAADTRAADYFEWRNPPLAVQAVNLPLAGLDIAVYGYWSDLIYDERAIVTVPVQPAAPAPAPIEP